MRFTRFQAHSVVSKAIETFWRFRTISLDWDDGHFKVSPYRQREPVMEGQRLYYLPFESHYIFTSANPISDAKQHWEVAYCNLEDSTFGILS